MLVDAAVVYRRAFHRARTSPRGSDERGSAVRGLLDSLAALITRHRPARLACCWDESWRPEWRVALLPSYKAARANPDGTEAMPTELAAQVPVIREVLDAFGLPVVGADGYEADDVIATLAAPAMDVDVVTSDRDLFQVIDDARCVRVLYCAHGVARAEVVTDSWLREHYGVGAAAYLDFMTLRGDPADGLPGVRGIGAKTAASLLARHRSLHGVVAAGVRRQFSPRLSDALMDAIGYVHPAKRVSTAVTDVPLPSVDLRLPSEVRDPDRLARLSQTHGLGGSVARLARALWPLRTLACCG